LTIIDINNELNTETDNRLFTNMDIDLSSIPHLKPMLFNALDLKYKQVLMVNAFIVTTILIAVSVGIFLATKGESVDFIYLPIAIVFLIIISLTFVVAHYGFYKKVFKLRDKDLIFRSGLWWSSETSVPFNRVQHSEVIQGPVDRFFKLAKLKVYTAGGHSSDLTIPGLSPEQAQYLKDFITNRLVAEEEE